MPLPPELNDLIAAHIVAFAQATVVLIQGLGAEARKWLDWRAKR